MKIDDIELMEKIKKSTLSEINKDRLVQESKCNGVFVWDYRKVCRSTIDGRWEQEKFCTLYTLFLKASKESGVDQSNNKSNFILASPAVVCALETLEQFDACISKMKDIQKVGTIGRYTVYRDAQARTDYAVVGANSTSGHIVDKSCRYVKIRGMSDSSLCGKLY